MKAKLSLLLATVLLMSLSVQAAKPQPEPELDPFIGLWEGVWDPTINFYGYMAIRSITVNHDGTYTIRGDWSDNTTGVLMGTGIVEDGVLVVDDMTQFTPPSGTTYAAPTTYTFDEENGVLREELYFPHADSTRNSILHKTSR